jgi:hypothetical protein
MKTCKNCKSLGIHYECELRYKHKSITNNLWNHGIPYETVIPIEKCPKPMTYKQLIKWKNILFPDKQFNETIKHDYDVWEKFQHIGGQ